MNLGLSIDRTSMFEQTKNLARGNLGIPILLLIILAMMTLPMPPLLLDIFFTFNITIALVVLCVSVYALRPLDFAVFPTILLVATLLRLALNVASTRVVLLHGHEGGAAAGKVIESFGEVVIGGNYAVGLIVFMILIIINFVVVTKGAGRIAEVSARFTLDAMPGKQMAVDADLNAGVIGQEEARERRSDITQEADFYGAMDGASKFVKGDAIAGILILVINLIGGVGIGMMQYSLAFGEALELYALLTIGDGLVAQIPALVLSTSAAIMVTRNNDSEMMGAQVARQMFSGPRSVGVASAILFVMGIVPGMPHFAFLSLATLGAMGAYYIYYIKAHKTEDESQKKDSVQGDGLAAGETSEAEKQDLSWQDVTPVDVIGLEVGYRLIPLVDKAQGGELLARIKGIRKKLSQDLGFLVPSVHIRDNLDLAPNEYRISLLGVNAGMAEVYPDRHMAINPGQVFGKLQGIETTDPAFGLPAQWIDGGQKDHAESLGYTVVDSSTVVATHLNTILQAQSHEIFGHEEVQELLKLLAQSSSKLAEDLPDIVNSNILLKVLQNLLSENVPIRDMRTIAETLAAYGGKSQDPVVLTSAVRVALNRVIVQGIYGHRSELPAITLDPELEQILLNTIQQSMQNGLSVEDAMVIEPNLAERLQKSLLEAAQKQEVAGEPAVLIVAAPLRFILSRFVRFTIDGLHVLSYQEIPDNKKVTIVASAGK
ncbi:MAG: flagellar biosynthesis protein FlhA [SAR86 cluster bacterium]|uniref:Flagellar biosynthesis protein FlhA n=1 Tax=SAR86 cluster bacterium TaxID=2030880 RepID=A0A2A4MJS0_9GAMM|nr:MAG: flagellar biosynthesis protein FlhA [SAR86 cluster bacterium]